MPSFLSYLLLLHHDFTTLAEVDAAKHRLVVQTDSLKGVPAFVHGGIQFLHRRDSRHLLIAKVQDDVTHLAKTDASVKMELGTEGAQRVALGARPVERVSVAHI